MKQILLLKCLLICQISSFAQSDFTRNNEKNPIYPEFYLDHTGRTSPGLVDIDNDGDLDCFLGNNDGTFTYGRNISGPGEVLFKPAPSQNALAEFDIGDDSTISFGDIDGDGDFDAVSGNEAGDIFFFQNIGDEMTPVFELLEGTNHPLNNIDHRLTTSDYNTFCRLFDYDNDGDLDLIFGMYTYTVADIRYFISENIGSESALELTTPTQEYFETITSFTNSFYSNHLDLADIDNDGDWDIIHARGASMRYIRNDGTLENPSFSILPAVENDQIFGGQGEGAQGVYPSIADLDGDGLLDLLCDGRVYPDLSDDKLILYRNTGNTGGQIFEVQTGHNFSGYTNKDLFTDFDFGDIDNDGDLDFIKVNSADFSSPEIFENRGPVWDQTFRKLECAESNFNVDEFVDCEDLDGDGFAEIISGCNANDFCDEVINVYINESDCDFNYSGNPFEGISFSDTEIDFADLDGDGDKDAFALKSGNGRFQEAQGDNGLIFYVNKTDSSSDPFKDIIDDFGNYKCSPTFVDYDNDGDLDLFARSCIDFSSTLLYIENIGTATDPNFIVLPEEESPAYQVLDENPGLWGVGDFNFLDDDNDGDLDLLVAYLGANFVYYENNKIETSLNEIASPETLLIYPNPAQSSITIEIEEGVLKNNSQLEVYDLLGRVKSVHTITTLTDELVLDVSSFESGTYFVKTQIDSRLFVSKFMVID